jgi:hypothetical protein
MKKITENLFSSRFLRKVTVATLCLAFFSGVIIFIAASCDKPKDQKKQEQPVIEQEDPVKEDVRIGWSLKGQDGDAYVENALNLERINELRELPATGTIFAYVYNRDGRGPPKGLFAGLVTYLDNIKNAGVEFEVDTIYGNDFFEADSIAAKQKLNLTMDLYSRWK